MNAPFPSCILVVDDDADAAWALSALLRSTFECEVHAATGGAEAIDLASFVRPDAVVIDIVMPCIDGLEVASIIRRLFFPGEAPRLVALTGLAVGEGTARPLEDAFDRCLRKPLVFEALVRALCD